METYLARQPILDKDQNLYGYELLYRQNSSRNSFDNNVDADHASSSVVESLHSIGIEKITAGKKAFVNLTQNFLSEGLATLFPKEVLVVEILENLEPTPDLIAACQHLKDLGYKIALDDFVYTPEHQPLVDLCDIIKLEFLPFSLENYRNIIQNIDLTRVTLLAEKVETREDFALALRLGFRLFQGYFFSKPVLMKNANISPNRITYMQLLKIVYEQEIDFRRISKIIRHDLALSYKMLRLVNSAYYGIRREIRDVQRAAAILGEKELKKWVSLLSMAGFCEDKPSELVRMSMVRARYCEQAAITLSLGDPEQFFLTGLFSLLDAIMDTDMDTVLSQMSLPELVRQSLVDKTGVGAALITLITAVETGDWDVASAQAQEIGIDAQTEAFLYMDALEWSMSYDS